MQPSPLTSVTAFGTLGTSSHLPVQLPSSPSSVDPGLSVAGLKLTPPHLQHTPQPVPQVIPQLVPPDSSAGLADHQQEPVFSPWWKVLQFRLATTCLSSRPWCPGRPLLSLRMPAPFHPHSATSSTSFKGWTSKASYTLILWTSPTTAPPLSRGSSWDTAPRASGDQGYVSLLIDLYPEQDSDLGAFYDRPADWAPFSYDDLQEAPSDSEADLANSDSLRTEDQSSRETVGAIRSYMKWLFILRARVCLFFPSG